jgi:hypothetical protein
MFVDVAGFRHFIEFECEAKAIADTKVVHRQDVRPAKAEDEKHLNRPSADTANFRQSRDQIFVAPSGQTARGRNDSTDRLVRDVPDRRDLCPGEPTRSQLIITDQGKISGQRKTASRKEKTKAAENRRRGACVELLIGYGMDEGFERSAAPVGSQGASANVTDDPGEDGIRRAEVVQRLFIHPDAVERSTR